MIMDRSVGGIGIIIFCGLNALMKTVENDKNWFYYVMNIGMSIGGVLLASGL